jgi:hypothetical protein
MLDQELAQGLRRNFACLARITNVAQIVTVLTGPSAWDQPVILAPGNAQVCFLCVLYLFLFIFLLFNVLISISFTLCVLVVIR